MTTSVAPQPLNLASADTQVYTDRDLVTRMAALAAHMLPLKAGVKRPVHRGWPRAAALTVEAAEAQLKSGRNLGINLAMSGWICVDTETALGTQAMIACGHKPFALPAKSKAGPRLADGSENTHRGGAHFVFRVPRHWGAAWLLPANRTGFRVIDGGSGDTFDVLAGVRYIVAPPSTTAETFGAAYTPGEGFYDDISDAPEWLRDTGVPVPHPALAAAHGCMLADQPRKRIERNARSLELDEELDQIADAEWFAGFEDHLYPTGDVDEDGCPEYSWHRAGNAKAATSHNCSQHGRKVKMWGNTMPSDLGFEPQATVSHLNLRAALREIPVPEVMREMGISPHDLTTAGQGEPPLQAIHVDEAASYAGFEAYAVAAEASGDRIAAYMWRQRASVCAYSLRSHHANKRERQAQAKAAGEVFVDTPVAPGMALLTPEQQAVVTAPIGPQEALHSVALPPVASRPMQQDPGPYPLDVLPPALRDMGIQMAELMSVPGALVGPTLLSVLSAACGPAITLVRPMWKEPGALWIGVAAPPGTKKSPVLTHVLAPLEEAAKLIDAELEDERRAAELRARAAVKAADAAELDAEHAEAERLAAATTPARTQGPTPQEIEGEYPAVLPPVIGTVDDAVARAVALRRTAEELLDAVPPKVRLRIGDTTPEKLQDMLSEQAGRGYMVIPEGGRLLDAATRGDAGRVDTSFLLSARDEEDIIVQRIKRGEVTCRRPSMCLLMMVQPDVLERALKGRDGAKTAVDSNGFIDRFLLSFCESIPDVFEQQGELDERAVSTYNKVIIDEFVRSYRARTARIKFAPTPDGALTLATIYDYIEAVIHSNCGIRKTMWAKSAGQVVRIARLFAQLEVADLTPELIHPIEARHFDAAWWIVYWHLCSYGAGTGTGPAASGEQLTEAAMAYVLRRLADGPLTRRQLRGDKTHRAYLDNALDRLANADSRQIELRDDKYRRL